MESMENKREEQEQVVLLENFLIMDWIHGLHSLLPCAFIRSLVGQTLVSLRFVSSLSSGQSLWLFICPTGRSITQGSCIFPGHMTWLKWLSLSCICCPLRMGIPFGSFKWLVFHLDKSLRLWLMLVVMPCPFQSLYSMWNWHINHTPWSTSPWRKRLALWFLSLHSFQSQLDGLTFHPIMSWTDSPDCFSSWLEPSSLILQ